MILIFTLGYLLIAFEHFAGLNKATAALMTGVLCWAVQFANHNIPKETNLSSLCDHLCGISQIIFFLLAALIIVELISAHKGFKILANCFKIESKRKILWMICIITFFLSSMLDNLTTTVIMISFLQKAIKELDDRLIVGGGVVIAANAGGVWTPIGDITTTMLWIGEKLSPLHMMTDLLVPSLVCLFSALLYLTTMLKGKFTLKPDFLEGEMEPMGLLVFICGIGALVFVPVFKLITGLPPFMGMLFGLSFMWFLTDIIHGKDESRQELKVLSVLSKIDLSGPLFFLGILLAVSALDAAGILTHLAKIFDETIGNPSLIAGAIGIASAIVDNIPLVAAAMGMYDTAHFPMDAPFWDLVAYSAGVGGSMLVIGSAAGVVYMGMEKVDFFWYLRRISLPATIGFISGFVYYLAVR